MINSDTLVCGGKVQYVAKFLDSIPILSEYDDEGYIYIVCYSNNRIKVGKTSNPRERLMVHFNNICKYGKGILPNDFVYILGPFRRLNLIESELVETFRRHFNQGIGDEWFYGNTEKIEQTINTRYLKMHLLVCAQKHYFSRMFHGLFMNRLKDLECLECDIDEIYKVLKSRTHLSKKSMKNMIAITKMAEIKTNRGGELRFLIDKKKMKERSCLSL